MLRSVITIATLILLVAGNTFGNLRAPQEDPLDTRFEHLFASRFYVLPTSAHNLLLSRLHMFNAGCLSAGGSQDVCGDRAIDAVLESIGAPCLSCIDPPPPYPPAINTAPQNPTFIAQVGGGNPLPRELTVSTGGQSWVVESNIPWATISPTQGSSGEFFRLSPNIQGLEAGTYLGDVIIRAWGIPDYQATIVLVLSPDPAPQISINDASGNFRWTVTSPTFASVAGAPSPEPLTLSVAVINLGDWSIEGHSPWFDVGPTSGPTGGQFTITPHTNGLGAGDYVEVLTIQSPGAADKVVRISLHLDQPQ